MAGNGSLWAIKQLGLMFAMIVTLVLVTILLMNGPCNDGKTACSIYGDSQAQGATAYADGTWLGVMGERALVTNWVLDCRVPRGPRRVLVVSAAGESLSTDFVFEMRTVVWLSFADSTISALSDDGD